jgi:hypothetical protein
MAIKKIQISLVLIVALLTGCEQASDHELKTKNLDVIAVDALLTSENISHSIRITHPVQEINAKPKPVSGADVAVSDGSATFIFKEDSLRPGYYTSKPFTAVINKTYSLSIFYQTKEYYATARSRRITFFRPVDYVKNEDDSLYHIIEEFKTVEPAMWKLHFDWRHVETGDTNQAVSYFYSLRRLDIPTIFAPDQKTIHFPKGTIITQKKYSLTANYTEYLRTMLLETEWRGGWFDMEPANVNTNLSEGAVGYFAVCNVMTDTIHVE